MKHAIPFLLAVLFLASCFTPATQVPTLTFTPAPTLTSTSTPESTVTQTPIPTPTITPSPTQVGGGSGRLIFKYKKDEFIKAFPDEKGEINVFMANMDGSNLTPVTNGLEGYNFLNDVSPNGTKVLVTSTSKFENKTSNLYLIDLNSLKSQPVKIASGLPNGIFGNDSAARWINDSEIAYIGQGKAGFGIYKINVDGTNPIKIEGNIPFEILAITSTRIYWDTQIDRVQGGNMHFLRYYVWWTSLDGTERDQLKFNGKQISVPNFLGSNIAFSPDGTKIAWTEGATPASGPPYHNYLHIAEISDINNPTTFETLDGDPILKWFSDGSKVLVFDRDSLNTSLESLLNYYKQHPKDPWIRKFNLSPSDNFDKIKNIYGLYEVSTSTNLLISNYSMASDLIKNMNLYDISPDGRLILFVTNQPGVNGYWDAQGTQLYFLNLETKTFLRAQGFNFLPTYWMERSVQWIP